MGIEWAALLVSVFFLTIPSPAHQSCKKCITKSLVYPFDNQNGLSHSVMLRFLVTTMFWRNILFTNWYRENCRIILWKFPQDLVQKPTNSTSWLQQKLSMPESLHTHWKWHFLSKSTHGNECSHQTTTNAPPSHLTPFSLISLSSPVSFVHPFSTVGLIPLRTAHWLWCSSFLMCLNVLQTWEEGHMLVTHSSLSLFFSVLHLPIAFPNKRLYLEWF